MNNLSSISIIPNLLNMIKYKYQYLASINMEYKIIKNSNLTRVVRLASVLLGLILLTQPIFADKELGSVLAGRIVLQVEENGEAYYISPENFERYSLGRPADAYDVMRWLGIGITNNSLSKFPIGLMNYDDIDSDQDGLSNRFENALGTDPGKIDSDDDGFTDLMEVEAGYNPSGTGPIPTDTAFTELHLGKIFLQVEDAGEAWYLDPVTKKRYYLGRPSDAFMVMRQLGLGITNNNINKIAVSTEIPNRPEPLPPPPPVCDNCPATSHSVAIANAAHAFRAGNTTRALNYFDPKLHKAVEYTLDNFTGGQRLLFGNILSGSKLKKSTETTANYSTEVYFSLGGYKVPITIQLKKQDDGSWVITNL